MISTIQLSHGSGRGLQELLHTIILPALFDSKHQVLEDAAVFPTPGKRLAFTTDSFVVQPLEFNGGDIGTLAVCGTINDLAAMGAKPVMLSLGLILEEGLPVLTLQKILGSIKKICTEQQVCIVCGDTKVIHKGRGDGMFINTSGIGVVPGGRHLSASHACPGDMVLISGPIGLHGIAILSAREHFGFASEAASDCAPLATLMEDVLGAAPGTRLMRDPTRGGCAAVLHEIAEASHATIVLDEESLPIPDVVRGACNFLGMDPLHIANEGKMIAIVPGEEADVALAAMHNNPLGHGARIIGKVTDYQKFNVVLKTGIGGTRIVDVPPGELLPRIC